MKDYRRNLIKRITDNVMISNDTDCWVWQGGDIYVRGEYMLPHCIMYICKNGPITNNEVVIQTCGDKRCCNPDHLGLKDKVEVVNVSDIRSKERQRGGYTRINWINAFSRKSVFKKRWSS